MLQHVPLLAALEKGIASGDITAIVPQDLEVQAHSTIWDSSSPFELTFLKMVPSTTATQITHEFTTYDAHSTASGRRFGNFGEKSLPAESRFQTSRKQVTIRLVGEKSSTFVLAAMEKTVSVNGATGAVDIESSALREQVLGRKQQAFLFSDTSKHRLGTASSRPAGLVQQIRERTDGTSGSSPFGSHVIDMKGKPLTQSTVREHFAHIVTQFGAPNVLVMDPYARADFEKSLDGNYFIPLPMTGQQLTLGQSVAGVQTQGQGQVRFFTDNMLQPLHPLSARGQYSATLDDDAPSGRPTINSVSASTGAGSEWDAASAGEIYWIITETVNEAQSLGSRYPATAATYTTVAAGDVVSFNVTPSNPNADSFLVYRGTDADGSTETPYLAFEIACTGSGAAVAFTDKNLDRPNTTTAFLLSINSAAQRDMGGADITTLDASRYFQQPDDETRNTISCVHLGPQMGMLNLAAILATVAQPLMFSAFSPQVRNARKNFVFKNIGRA
jgi:hypothetical protein